MWDFLCSQRRGYNPRLLLPKYLRNGFCCGIRPKKRPLSPIVGAMTITQRLLVNALPKSGTHLLAKAVEQCGYQEHLDPDDLSKLEHATPLFYNYREVKNGLAALNRGEAAPTADAICVGTLTPVWVSADVMRGWLAAMPTGTYALGHIAYSPALTPLLAELNYRHVFIIRDPRAVLTSLLSFILDTRGMPKPHFLEADFQSMSPKERLMFLLEGGYAPEAGVHVRGFADVFQSMLAWRNDPACLLVKFEELVGSQGGGDDELQRQTLEQIEAHLGRKMQDTTIYSTNSRTFRKGNINSWRDAHDADTLKILNDYCRPLCEAANYQL